jgi:hypothetical protein
MFPSGRVLLALLACTFVCSCDDAPPAAADPAAGTAARPGTRPESPLPPEMVAAVSASKSSLIIGVHFALGGQPVIGQPLPVDIAIVPHQPFAAVSVHFLGPDGLAVTSGKDMPTQSAIVPGKILTHKLTLEPSREGVFMVTAAVETESEDGMIVRIYSIPVIVSGSSGKAAAAPAGPAAGAPQ